MNITKIKAKDSNYAIRSITNANYLKDISKIPVMTPQEERELFIELKNSKDRVKNAAGTPNYHEVLSIENKLQLKIRNEVISRNQRLNYAAAKRYDNNDIMMELVSVGTMGMIEAFEEYDLNKGVRFCTYAMYYIRRAINAFLNKENITIRTNNDSKIISKVRKIENKFMLQEGRYPTPDEIKDILDEQYNIKDADTLDLYMANVQSIDAPISNDDDGYVSEMTNDYNISTSSYNNYLDTEELDYKRNIINNLLNTLPEREKIILSMSMGYNSDREYKDAEIAEKLNMTSERVRQLKNEAIKRLQFKAACTF